MGAFNNKPINPFQFLQELENTRSIQKAIKKVIKKKDTNVNSVASYLRFGKNQKQSEAWWIKLIHLQNTSISLLA